MILSSRWRGDRESHPGESCIHANSIVGRSWTRRSEQSVCIDGNECLERYLRDVRRFAVLSREGEQALARQIAESRTQWQEQLLEHLLYIPLLLAWRASRAQGMVRLSSLCRPAGATPTIVEFNAVLQRLCALRMQMREVVQGQDAQRAHTLAM